MGFLTEKLTVFSWLPAIELTCRGWSPSVGDVVYTALLIGVKGSNIVVLDAYHSHYVSVEPPAECLEVGTNSHLVCVSCWARKVEWPSRRTINSSYCPFDTIVPDACT